MQHVVLYLPKARRTNVFSLPMPLVQGAVGVQDLTVAPGTRPAFCDFLRILLETRETDSYHCQVPGIHHRQGDEPCRSDKLPLR